MTTRSTAGSAHSASMVSYVASTPCAWPNAAPRPPRVEALATIRASGTKASPAA